MNKKRFFKTFIVFCLVFTTITASSLSASAYVPLFSFEDTEWDIDSPDTYIEFYPERIPNYAPADSVYSIEDLNGKAYFCSRYGEDTTVSLHEEIVPPAIPGITWTEDSFGMLYEVNEELWFLYCSDNTPTWYVAPILQNQNINGPVDKFNFVFTPTESCNIKLFKCKYPYTGWTLDTNSTYSGSQLNKLQVRNWHDSIQDDNYHWIWSSHPVCQAEKRSDGTFQLLDDYVIIDNGGKSFSTVMSSTYLLTPLTDVYNITGQISASFTGEDLRFLTTGECCIRIDDLGVIVGSESIYCMAFYHMYIRDSEGNLIDEIPLYGNNLFDDSSKNIADSLDIYDLRVGDYRFRDVINFSLFDYDFSDLNTFDNYTVTFVFNFISDGFDLFFPGTLEIIEFDSYDAQIKHDDVKDAINEATDIISGGLSDVVDSVNGTKSELTQEIVDAVTDITSSIDDARTDIVGSVESAASDIMDGLDNVSGSIDDASDKITDKLEDTKNGILDGIKSFFIPSEDSMTSIKVEWDELLSNRFGALYEAGGIISDFGEQMNMDSIRTRGIKNTIVMPSVTVDLAGTPFTFGGYEVQIVPEGFDFLITVVKGITSIVCTLAFINALRKKYDKIIGGSSA